MSKIEQNHITREAYLYIRQSTPEQVRTNVESQRVQRQLCERAKEFGWDKVNIIDDDLGCSASGSKERVGFERLLSAVCAGSVGAIFAFEASRLARNGREWHTLLELCGIVDTLLIDPDGIYDPKLANDRLLLGLKGTLSEMEVKMFHARSKAAMQEKAKRGAMYGLVAIGYQKTRDGRLEKFPDLRVQRALQFVFDKFKEIGSVRQLALWMQHEGIKVPVMEHRKSGSTVHWKLPRQGGLSSMLRNPIYAGAYVWGRRKTYTTIKNGKKHTQKPLRRDPAEWDILIRDHHEGYISWEQFEANLDTMSNNSFFKGEQAKGAVRGGASLFTGILRCGKCGRKIGVHYSGAYQRSIRYNCNTNSRSDDGGSCLRFSARVIEQKITEQLLETLSPLGIEAAIEAAETLSKQQAQFYEQRELELVQARYECERMRSQYDAADPANRLVAGELERRWEEALRRVNELETQLKTLSAETMAVSKQERAALLELGQNFEEVWNSAGITQELKKRIARAAIKEIIFFQDEKTIRVVIHWQGGDHTEFSTHCLTYRDSSPKTAADVVELIRQLVRQMPDRHVARVLNRLGKRTASGFTWNEHRVCAIRHGHKILAYERGEELTRGEVNMVDAAKGLGVDRRVVKALIAAKILPAKQVCFGAPWVILQNDLKAEAVHKALANTRLRTAPCTQNQNQVTLNFQ